MKHSLFSVDLENGRRIAIAPVSIDAFEDNNAHSLGDDSGYFIYEVNTKRQSSGIEILAKAASYDAAMRLADIMASGRLRDL